MNFPIEINGQTFDNYVDWIAPAFLVTLVSLPAGSVPAGMTADGLPVGLQIVAPRFDEPHILSVAKLVQQAATRSAGRRTLADSRSSRRDRNGTDYRDGTGRTGSGCGSACGWVAFGLTGTGVGARRSLRPIVVSGSVLAERSSRLLTSQRITPATIAAPIATMVHVMLWFAGRTWRGGLVPGGLVPGD